MSEPRRQLAPPSSLHIVKTLAWRELRLASRRKLVRALFVMSLVPLAIFAAILVVSVVSEQALHAELDWDPVQEFLGVQLFPVALLALGLGTPIIARDRAEDVLYLYATRPLLPWHYTVGKVLAVWLPCAALLFLPALIMAGLRLGSLARVDTWNFARMLLQIAAVSALFALGYAGLTVGASALTKRARWSLMLALGVDIVLPAFVLGAGLGYPVSPSNAGSDLLYVFFEDFEARRLMVAVGVLLFYGALGFIIPTWRMSQEMTP